jgi:hypothetical protein
MAGNLSALKNNRVHVGRIIRFFESLEGLSARVPHLSG